MTNYVEFTKEEIERLRKEDEIIAVKGYVWIEDIKEVDDNELVSYDIDVLAVCKVEEYNSNKFTELYLMSDDGGETYYFVEWNEIEELVQEANEAYYSEMC